METSASTVFGQVGEDSVGTLKGTQCGKHDMKTFHVSQCVPICSLSLLFGSQMCIFVYSGRT